jgi:hypothetical protein
MSFDRFLATLRTQALIEVAEHWNAARGGRTMPAWRDIVPDEIRRHLPIVWAWRHDPGQGGLVGRLAGQAVIDVIGRQIRGRRIEECFAPESLPVIRERFDRVVEGPLLMRSAGPVYVTSGRHGAGERISMPLSDDGSRCDGIFGATVYTIGNASPDNRVVRYVEGEEVEFFDIGARCHG